MTSDRIKEIQLSTAYPESLSVKQALLQVWNECEQSATHLTTENTRLREALEKIVGSKKEEEYANGAFGFDEHSTYQESAFISGVDWMKEQIKQALTEK